jgi:hypothetical protein
MNAGLPMTSELPMVPEEGAIVSGAVTPVKYLTDLNDNPPASITKSSMNKRRSSAAANRLSNRRVSFAADSMLSDHEVPTSLNPALIISDAPSMQDKNTCPKDEDLGAEEELTSGNNPEEDEDDLKPKRKHRRTSTASAKRNSLVINDSSNQNDDPIDVGCDDLGDVCGQEDMTEWNDEEHEQPEEPQPSSEEEMGQEQLEPTQIKPKKQKRQARTTKQLCRAPLGSCIVDHVYFMIL